jgi:hypothetical protein
MLPRLKTILELSRGDSLAKYSMRINLLFVLKAVSVDTGDKELEQACDEEIKALQAERDRQRDQPPPA